MADGRKTGKVAETVWKMARPYAERLGLSIWDVRFVREGSSYFLRIFIDRPGGVGISDCEAMSRAVSDPLDELDPIRESYTLEVSSPGINRELTREEHFRACMGERVAARLIRPREDGERVLSGRLAGFGAGEVSLKTEKGETVALRRKDLAWVRLMEDDDVEEFKES